jgi:opacity protein-like surface antigen
MSLKWIIPLVAMPGAAAAQGTWDYTATFYGWFPGVASAVETPLGTVESEIDFQQILETLDIAFLGALEARRGRLSLIGDLQYFDIGVQAETPRGTLFSDAEVDSELIVLGAYAAYAVIDRPDLRFDVGAGLRYADATFETHLDGQGAIADRTFSSDAGWVDGVIAARINRRFNDRWAGWAFADIGGFGLGESSDLTWQVAAGVGYRINETWTAVGGYRHLAIERGFDDVDISVDVSGPFLGFQMSF